MIAKLIVHADSRQIAARSLADACGGVEVWPVKSNAAFLARCVSHADFIAGRVDTNFIEARLEALTQSPPPSIAPTQVALGGRLDAPESGAEPRSPWRAGRGPTGFRLNASSVTSAEIFVNDVAVTLGFDFSEPQSAPSAISDQGGVVVFSRGAALVLSASRRADRLPVTALGDGVVRAPMPGRLVAVTVRAGDRVTAGQTLAVLEAMKMEHALTAPADGEVAEVLVSQGDQVTEGVTLMRLRGGS